MTAPSGVTGAPWSIRLGAQYAAVSRRTLQVVSPPRSDAAVEVELVAVLPKKSWRCDMPAMPGWTMGSSVAARLKPHLTTN